MARSVEPEGLSGEKHNVPAEERGEIEGGNCSLQSVEGEV